MARGPTYSRDACVLTTFLNGTERLIHQPHKYIFLDFLLVFFSSLLWISPSNILCTSTLQSTQEAHHHSRQDPLPPNAIKYIVPV